MDIFRVTQTDKGSHTIILFDGQLRCDSVGVTSDCCERAVATGRRVHLFLREVSSIDTLGRDLLARLTKRGVVIHGSGLYTSYLAQSIKQSFKARPRK